MKFHCNDCGQEHDSSAISLQALSPEAWESASDEERSRSELTRDFCVIRDSEGSRYFVCCRLELPVHNSETPFVYGVWGSVSETSYREMSSVTSEPGGDETGPWFSWFSVSLPGYPETLNLKAKIIYRDPEQRPIMTLEPTDHPLAVEQRSGITRERLREIVTLNLHPDLHIATAKDSVSSAREASPRNNAVVFVLLFLIGAAVIALWNAFR